MSILRISHRLKGINMGKGIRQQVGDRKDNNRIFAWGIVVVILLVVAAVVINAFFWRSDPTPAIADTVIQRTNPGPVDNQTPK